MVWLVTYLMLVADQKIKVTLLVYSARSPQRTTPHYGEPGEPVGQGRPGPRAAGQDPDDATLSKKIAAGDRRRYEAPVDAMTEAEAEAQAES